MFNHVESHAELTNKGKMFYNIKSYCKSHKLEIDSFIPKTFVFNIDSETYEVELQKFLKYYNDQL